MKRSLIPVLALALALLLLGGCALPSLPGREEAAPTEGAAVYRLTAGGEAGELVRAEYVPDMTGTAADIDQLLAYFAGAPADPALRRALPEGVTVTGWSLSNGVVTLELSEELMDAPVMERTEAALCAALTLCRLDTVEAVTVTSGGQTLYSGLMPEDALLTAEDTDPYVRQLRLYFADAEGRWLTSEYHSLTLEEDTSAERYVVEELLRGPNNGELRSALPAGTTLRSCVTENGVCTVDLSAAFLENRPETALGERLAVYSLVDSLTALAGVDSVRLLVEGAPVDAYVYRSLAEPLARYEAPIGPASEPKGEFEAALHLVLPGLAAITPLPFRVSEAGYDSRAEAVLAELLTAAEPGYPSLFPASLSVTGLTLRGTTCVVELSESFFASLPEEDRYIAVQSMAATLCGLEEIASVRFTVSGDSAVFDGTDYTGPWRDFTEIEVP